MYNAGHRAETSIGSGTSGAGDRLMGVRAKLGSSGHPIFGSRAEAPPAPHPAAHIPFRPRREETQSSLRLGPSTSGGIPVPVAAPGPRCLLLTPSWVFPEELASWGFGMELGDRRVPGDHPKPNFSGSIFLS